MSVSQLNPVFSNAIQDLHLGRVLVVGDMAIDEMVYGHTARLSREAPVLILHHQKSDTLLGAASNAAHNLASLGSEYVGVVGVYGADDYGQKLLHAFSQANIAVEGMGEDNTRPTTTKSRISGIANHSITQQIVRIDRESRHPLNEEQEQALIARLTMLAPQVDAILLSDYGLGVVTPGVIAACRQLSQQYNLVWTVDSQQNLRQFAGATIVTPNQPEAEANCGVMSNTFSDVIQLRQYGTRLLETIQTQSLLVTRGGEGMTLFGPPGCSCDIPVFNKSDVFDVTGAGDTVVATLTLALAAYRRKTGKQPDWSHILLASVLGNLAASIVVKRFGVATTTTDELQEALDTLINTLPPHDAVKNWLLAFGLVATVASASAAPEPLRHDIDVHLNGHTFAVQVAQSVAEFETGLMHREQIPPNQGMWFGFNQPFPVTMWMKGCLTSLDMVFIKQQRVQAVLHNLPPCQSEPCPYYHSTEPVDGVLELPGGTALRLKLQPGQMVSASQPS
jgi:D-glycero-beta-D-manno-heptose-7-phosphate kinase